MVAASIFILLYGNAFAVPITYFTKIKIPFSEMAEVVLIGLIIWLLYEHKAIAVSKNFLLLSSILLLFIIVTTGAVFYSSQLTHVLVKYVKTWNLIITLSLGYFFMRMKKINLRLLVNLYLTLSIILSTSLIALRLIVGQASWATIRYLWHNNITVDYLVVGNLIAIAIILTHVEKNLMSFFLSCYFLVGIMLLASTGPFLYSLFAILLLNLFPIKKTTLLFSLILIGAIIAAFCFHSQINLPIIEKIHKKIETGVSENARMIPFKKGMNLYYQNPILGSGLGAYRDYAGGAYPHNILIEALSETGILGFYCLASFFFILLILMLPAALKDKLLLTIYIICLFWFLQSMKSDSFSGLKNAFLWFGMFIALVNYPKKQLALNRGLK